MKYKKLLLIGLFLFLPFVSKAEDNLEDIKDIRGDKNYFQDLMLDNGNLYIDISLFEKYNQNPKDYGVNLEIEDKKDTSKNFTGDILDQLNGKTFSFFSKSDSWKTILTFKENGKFSAEYSDNNLDFLHMTKFNGKFSVDKKVNDTTYILNLDQAEITNPSSNKDETVINGKEVEVQYSKIPYGFAKNNKSDYSFQDKFTLYLPYRKRSEMSKKVNQWIDIRGDNKYIDNYESRIFILVNNKTIDTFLEEIK